MGWIGWALHWPTDRLFGFRADPEGVLALNVGLLDEPCTLALNYTTLPGGSVRVESFAHGYVDDPIFDPQRDRPEMGAITEAVRTTPRWAADGPFWQLYELDARIVLLGVP